MSFKVAEDYKPLIRSQIKSNCGVSIVIPVRNEAENLKETLDSLTDQIDFNQLSLDQNSFEIIVLVNNSSDESAEIVKLRQKTHSKLGLHLAEMTLSPEQANIGYVRRYLMTEAYLRLCQNKFGGGVIMTTDGDTRVVPNWIAANLREIKDGADAVGGRILIKTEDLDLMNSKAKRFHLLDTGYRLLAAEIEARLDFVAHDHLPRHHQHFNGSFAVTTAAFEKAGGVPAVSCLEDVAFFQSLLRIDARFRHSPLVRVYTSSRAAGRAECGLSTQINEWRLMGENGASYFVESALAIAQRIMLRGKLRVAWAGRQQNHQQLDHLAGKLLISSSFLKKELEVKQTFGSLLEKVRQEQHENGEWAKTFPLICVSRAIADLRQLRATLRQENQFAASSKAFSQTSSR